METKMSDIAETLSAPTKCIGTEQLMFFTDLLNPEIVEILSDRVLIHAETGTVAWYYITSVGLWAFETLGSCPAAFTGI